MRERERELPTAALMNHINNYYSPTLLHSELKIETLLPSAGKLENCSTGVMVKDVSKGQEAPQQQQLPEQ